MGVDQLAEADAHLLFDDTGLVHMAADLEQLGALVVLAPEAREPRRAAPQDRRDDRDALDIVDRRRAAIEARARRKWRLQARLALLALEALDRKSTTSELQSLMRSSYAVFCLKQKKKNNTHDPHTMLTI